MSKLFSRQRSLFALRVAPFTFWSLRRRGDQIIPVALAMVLLIGTLQAIGMLHDISSTLTQQQIARSWRGPYDLLVRPRSGVSQPEQSAGWINPQSILESYGGINAQQVASIRALPHITGVIAFANVGWQPLAMQIPLLFSAQGIYRVSAQWSGQNITASETPRYIQVTDLSRLTSEQPPSSPPIQPLVMVGNVPVTFFMPVQVIQAQIGVPPAQQSTLAQTLLAGLTTRASVRLVVRVDKLLGNLQSLPSCLNQSSCWQPAPVQQKPAAYQANGVQLLRFSTADYTSSPQQIASGQVSIQPLGSDAQGPLYRLPLPSHIPAINDPTPNPSGQLLAVIPLAAPEHLPLITGAVRFIPLAQACNVTGPNCYSGLYIRMSGVDNYNKQSLALLQSTSAAITARTGLYVDILDGSSPRQVAIAPSAQSGQTITSSWRVVGVAIQIAHGVDSLQVMLLALCSLVCLLAIGSAGVLVGIGRKNDAMLLRQLGWPPIGLALVLLLDALYLSLPGLLLGAALLLATRIIWPSSLPALIPWLLLCLGAVTYCCALVGTTYFTSASSTKMRPQPVRADLSRPSPIHRPAPIPVPPMTSPAPSINSNLPAHSISRSLPARSINRLLQWFRRYYLSQAFHEKVTAPFVCSLAVGLAVFLLAIEYLLVASFNQVLVVTVLGRQVRESLEGPQFSLLLLVLLAALLTVGLCTKLLLHGKRKEMSLLAMVGWERKAVLLRILRDEWWPALLSGEAGALLALLVSALGGAFPPPLMLLVVLCCGPLLGVAFVSLAAIGPAWQELERVFS